MIYGLTGGTGSGKSTVAQYLREFGCEVVDADDPTLRYGTLSGVSKTGANDVWHVRADNGQEYLLPAIPPVVIETDVAHNVVRIRPLKGIFDDAH